MSNYKSNTCGCQCCSSIVVAVQMIECLHESKNCCEHYSDGQIILDKRMIQAKILQNTITPPSYKQPIRRVIDFDGTALPFIAVGCNFSHFSQVRERVHVRTENCWKRDRDRKRGRKNERAQLQREASRRSQWERTAEPFNRTTHNSTTRQQGLALGGPSVCLHNSFWLRRKNTHYFRRATCWFKHTSQADAEQWLYYMCSTWLCHGNIWNVTSDLNWFNISFLFFQSTAHDAPS